MNIAQYLIGISVITILWATPLASFSTFSHRLPSYSRSIQRSKEVVACMTSVEQQSHPPRRQLLRILAGTVSSVAFSGFDSPTSAVASDGEAMEGVRKMAARLPGMGEVHVSCHAPSRYYWPGCPVPQEPYYSPSSRVQVHRTSTIQPHLRVDGKSPGSLPMWPFLRAWKL